MTGPDILASIVYPNLHPEIFRIGPLAVRWYGLSYLLGIVVGYMVLRRMIRGGMLHITKESLDDLIPWLGVGIIVGGRLGWWLVYHRAQPGVIEPWYEPIAMWHGGMSFHGGLTGVVLVLVLWSWAHQVSLANLADCMALVTPIGLFFGRLANFINHELVGRTTDVPWGVIFPGDTVARHPSQIYEAILEGPVLLGCLWAASRWGRPRDGRIAALFLILYGVFRFAVEFTRQPDEQLGFIWWNWLTMGQILSAVIVVVGGVVWVAAGRE